MTNSGRRALKAWAKAQKAGRGGRQKTRPHSAARLAWYVKFTEFGDLTGRSDVWARIQEGIGECGNSIRWLAVQIKGKTVKRWLSRIDAVVAEGGSP